MFRTILTLLLLLAGFGSVSLADDWGALELLGRSVDPSTKAKFPFIPDRSFESSYLNSPVFVARGAEPGPTLCITAGVHGDELNGVEVARRAFSRLDPAVLRGTLIVLPSVNAEGVRTGNRYLSDRRDLNRAFPGREDGSVAALIAHAVFKVVERCNALVDLHTASDNRTNLPQIRANMDDPETAALADRTDLVLRNPSRFYRGASSSARADRAILRCASAGHVTIRSHPWEPAYGGAIRYRTSALCSHTRRNRLPRLHD